MDKPRQLVRQASLLRRPFLFLWKRNIFSATDVFQASPAPQRGPAMNCPKCHAPLLESILRRDDDNAGFCPRCHRELKPGDVTAEACPLVQDGEVRHEHFDPEDCFDCICDTCILGTTFLDDFGMIQDEEGNWCYPGDE